MVLSAGNAGEHTDRIAGGALREPRLMRGPLLASTY
jgi:hypothetical protein